MDEIIVNSTLNGNKLISTINAPKNLRKYFISSELFVYYNTNLSADISILNIPLISTILPLAWLTKTDIKVEKLDKKYFESMNIIKHEFNRIFPRGRFTTKIIVDDLVENKTNSQETAMLFSGGIDSTYTLIKNINLKPRLIMFHGFLSFHLDPTFKQYGEMLKKTYSDFAKQEGLSINFIDSNTSNILNKTRIAHDFHRILRGTNLWLGLQEPLVLLGLPAPLSIGRFNRLLIAASADPSHDYYKHPEASQPLIDEKFAWADLRVMHDGFIHRFAKLNLIKEYLEQKDYQITVCNDPPPNRLNCSACEKCFRTIAPMVLIGIDPNNCGFEVNSLTFKKMRFLLENKKIKELEIDRHWIKLRNLIPSEFQTDLYGSRDFFVWLKSLNINSIQETRNLQKDIFNMLPYSLAKLVDACYYSASERSLLPILKLKQQINKRRSN